MVRAVSFITSNKGRQLLVHGNYVYYVIKTIIKVKYWRCEDRSCNAGVHTDVNNVFIKIVGNHLHLPSLEEIEARIFK